MLVKTALILTIELFMASSSTAWTQELNERQGIGVEAGAKINRMQAETNRLGQQDQQKRSLTNPAKCGASVGNVYVPKAGQAPREVNTFVKGDVISVCK